jgi:hypothetical protein
MKAVHLLFMRSTLSIYKNDYDCGAPESNGHEICGLTFTFGRGSAQSLFLQRARFDNSLSRSREDLASCVSQLASEP